MINLVGARIRMRDGVFSIDREQSVPGIAAGSFAAYLHHKSSTLYNIQQAA